MLVAPTAANARKVAAALAEFGFTKLGADWAWFAKPCGPTSERSRYSASRTCARTSALRTAPRICSTSHSSTRWRSLIEAAVGRHALPGGRLVNVALPTVACCGG